MKISIFPHIMLTITLLGATLSTANVMAMKAEGEGAPRRRSSSAAPQQPRQLSELEKYVQNQVQKLQCRIARGVWNGTIQPGDVSAQVAQAEEIKATQNTIKEKQIQVRNLLDQNPTQDDFLQQIDPLIDVYTANAYSPREGAFLIKVLNQVDTTQVDIVKKLLLAGADPNTKKSYYGETPLHIAAQRNLPAHIRLLIAYGADIDEKDKHSEDTPLITAARNDRLEAVQALLEPIEKTTVAAEWLESPLELIPNITQGYLGADAMIKNKYDQTAADLTKKDAIRKMILEKMINQLTKEETANGEILRPIVRGIYKCSEQIQKDLFRNYQTKLIELDQDAAAIPQTTEVLKAIDDFDQTMVSVHKPSLGSHQHLGAITVRTEEADKKITEYIRPAIDAIKKLNGMPRQIAMDELTRVIQHYDKTKHDYYEKLHKIATDLMRDELGYNLPPLQLEKAPQ